MTREISSRTLGGSWRMRRRDADSPRGFCAAHNKSYPLFVYRCGYKESRTCPDCAVELEYLIEARRQIGNYAPKSDLIALAEKLANRELPGLKTMRGLE